MLHFKNRECKVSVFDAITSSINYTLKKFIKFLPYTITIVFVSLFVLHVVVYKDFEIKMILYALLESCMIIRGDGNVGVLWYLAAMFFVYPFFCFVLQKFSFKIVVGGVCLASAYHLFTIGVHCFFPWHYIRAAAGLSLGVITYAIAEVIKRNFSNERILRWLCNDDVCSNIFFI